MLYYGINATDLWREFEAFNEGEPIGPAINKLIEKAGTNGGRSDFHIKLLRDEFYKEMAKRHIYGVLPC